VLFEASLQKYENQTDIALAKHPLAEQLQHCDPVESVTAILQEQIRACSEFRGSDRITKSLNGVVSVLCTLSASVNFGLVRLKVLMGCFMSLMLYFIAIPPCESNIYRFCHPTCCMSLSFLPTRIYVTSKCFRLSRTLVHTIHLLTYSSRSSPF